MSAVVSLLLGAVRWATGVQPAAHPTAPAPAGVPRIYYAAHTSHLDTVLILAALPPALRRDVHPVAARDYWGAGPLRRFVAQRCLRAVLIDRCSAPGEDALAPVAERLARGDSVIFSPRGRETAARSAAACTVSRRGSRTPSLSRCTCATPAACCPRAAWCRCR